MLEVLDLSGNSISGKVPDWIAELSKLRILVLRSNNLEGEIPFQIGYLQKLQILDLALNHLSGLIPQCLSNLATLRNTALTGSRSHEFRYGIYYKEEINLVVKGREWAYKYILYLFTSLDLSANNLSGDIPKGMGHLKGLHSLNLSHNQLTGFIPQELGEIIDLEALDMSCNQLSGRIPKTFVALNSLGYLNLSNNNLSGTIPAARHLDTFGASSFSDNPDLCGFPLQKNCSDPYSYNEEAEDDEGEQSVDWWDSWESGMGMGCVIVWGSVIGAIASSGRLRTRYCQFVDSIVNILL